MLAGVFDGGEPELAASNCGDARYQNAYQAVQFTVSADGTYNIANPLSSADWWWDGDFPGYGLDTELLVFEGVLDNIASLENHLVWQVSIYDQASVSLQVGRTYTLIVLHPCYDIDLAVGTWLVTMRGPGQVQSTARREIPQYLTGGFDSQSPRVKGRCGQSLLNTEVVYKQVGPIRASRNGTYYLANGRQIGVLETCQAVYSAPFDPSNVKANLVGSGYEVNVGATNDYKDQWQVELQAGRDYWLVIQPNTATVVTGEYFFILAPPASLQINPGLTGLWADLNTPGQGMYLDVFNSIDSVFLAWFTYDLQRPAPGVKAVLGDPGHRWLTGLGAIEGNSSDIEAVWTSGGLFDSSHPKPARNVNGHVRLEFDSCTSGRAIYNFGSPSLSGVVDLKRPFEDALGIAHCEQFQQGPGIPGPL